MSLQIDRNVLRVTDTRTGEFVELTGPNDTVMVRVRRDGSWAFRRRFHGVRRVLKVWTRWQWKRGVAK